MATERRQRLIAGGALIVFGLVLWGLQRFDAIGHAAFFLLAGGAFLAAYFAKREYGFLIPGCILLGLGAAAVGSDSFLKFGNALFLGLGFGFLAIFLIALLYERRTDWWPLIPGGVLILLGVGHFDQMVRFIFRNWPLALVIAGVLVMIGAFGRRSPRSD